MTSSVGVTVMSGLNSFQFVEMFNASKYLEIMKAYFLFP